MDQISATEKIKASEVILKEGDEAIWAFYVQVLKSGNAKAV